MRIDRMHERQPNPMRKFISTSLFTLLTVAPAIAAASPGGGESAAPTGIAGVLAAGTALVVSVTALVRAVRGDRRAERAATQATQASAAADQAAESSARAAAAAAWADRLANAQSDGVVLVLSYPGTVASCRGLLETNGWRVQYYAVTQAELDAGHLLPGPHVIEDVRAADAIVIEGLNEAGMARLAGMREFRDHIRSGAGVALYTGGRNYRYDLTLWGECDQGVTMPVTAEAAVRASLARRDATARRQGIRPGTLAAARQELLAQASSS